LTPIFEITAPSRRTLLVGAGALTLAACGRKAAPTNQRSAPVGTLDWAVAGPWRSPSDRQRDRALHPIETLTFFGLQPGMTVCEVWPGTGWWTEILGPYLTAGKGKLYAATFETPNPDDPAAQPVVDAYRKMVADKPDLYGAVTLTAFGPHASAIAPETTADLVLFFDLDHWMAAGLAEKAFHDAFTALKPGGVLGVVQARADVGGEQDPLATNSYVQEAYVKQLAAEVGFGFDKSSEINANPKDRKDAKRALPFTQAVEPDRMTLRFLKK
jgi:predicted methyltransferase